MKKMIVLLAVATAILMSSLAMAGDGDGGQSCTDNPWQFGCPLWQPSR